MSNPIVAVDSYLPEVQLVEPGANCFPVSMVQTWPQQSGNFGVLASGVNNQADFDIASGVGLLDLANSYWTVNLAAATGTCRIPGDVSGIISRVVVGTQSGTQILDSGVDAHCNIQRMLDIVYEDPGRPLVGTTGGLTSSAQMKWIQGKENLLQPDAYQTTLTTTAKPYVIKPKVPFLEECIIPLCVMGPIRITFFFTNDHLIVSSLTGAYVASNLIMQTCYRPLDPEYIARLKVAGRSKALVIGYRHFVFQQQNLTASQQNCYVNYGCQYLRGVFGRVVNTANYSSYGYDNLSQSLIPYPLTQIQLTCGAVQFPQGGGITTYSQEYFELIKYFGCKANAITRLRYSDSSLAFQSGTTFGSDQSSLCPLNIFAIPCSKTGEMFSGISTKQGVPVLLYAAQAPAANSQIQIVLDVDLALFVIDTENQTVVGL